MYIHCGGCLIFFQTSSKKKKEQERNSNLIEKLQEEKQRQDDNNRLVTSWIKKEKDSWFSPSESAMFTARRKTSVHVCVCVDDDELAFGPCS